MEKLRNQFIFTFSVGRQNFQGSHAGLGGIHSEETGLSPSHPLRFNPWSVALDLLGVDLVGDVNMEGAS